MTYQSVLPHGKPVIVLPAGWLTNHGYSISGGGGRQAKINNANAEQVVVVKEIPKIFSVGSFPNPFNPSAKINYQLPIDGRVRLLVFDVLGRQIETLVDASKPSGFYSVTFDASRFPSGIYFARISVTSNEGKPFVKTVKLLLTK